MPNYLQYINMIQNTVTNNPRLQFLVSGVDPHVRDTVLSNIIVVGRQQNSRLFIVDNTRNGYDLSNTTQDYGIVSVTSGDISLCCDLLDTNSLQSISRFREILSVLGFNATQAMKINTYLNFVKETERRLDNHVPLTIGKLEEYSAAILVEYKLEQLVANGKLNEENRQYLLARYSEVAAAAADFEHFLILLTPFIGGTAPRPDQIVLASLGEFANDDVMRNLICRLLVSHIKKDPTDTTVLILDDTDDDRDTIIDFLRLLPSAVDVHLFSKDIFSLTDNGLSTAMNQFPIRIYSRHEDMGSCLRIEKLCGEIDVVKKTTTVSRDRRLRANTPIDMLFNLNKVETEITNAPVREPKFRKEAIQSLPPGAGIVDFAGNKTIFMF